METDICDVQIKRDRGHWEIYINGKFFCTADSYVEAVNELHEVYRNRKERNYD